MKKAEMPMSDLRKPLSGGPATTTTLSAVDLAFINAGCSAKTGIRWLIVPPRRLLRRILRPIFQHQAVLFQSLCARLDAAERRDVRIETDLKNLRLRQETLGDQIQATQALGWDHVALVRRLAVLEDRVETLLRDREDEASESARFSTVSETSRAKAC